MRSTIDHQKTKFYQAEHQAIIEHYQEHGKEILGLDEAQWFLNDIKSSAYYKKHNGSPDLILELFECRKEVIGYYSHKKNCIFLDPDEMTEINICHEVAHHLQFQISDDLPAHGPVFTTFYLALVFTINNNGYFSTLFNSLLEHDVDYYHGRLEADLLL